MNSFSVNPEEAKQIPPGWPKIFYHRTAPDGRVFYRPEDVPVDWVSGPHLIRSGPAPAAVDADEDEDHPRRRRRAR